jgi:hypothetical protein
VNLNPLCNHFNLHLNDGIIDKLSNNENQEKDKTRFYISNLKTTSKYQSTHYSSIALII